MNEIILHHYPQSPVSEKVCVVLGIKGLAWRSVEIPRLPPKPDVMPLIGGYRRKPIMQVGADVYCDSQCILRELQRRHPQPTLFPGGADGLPWGIARWTDALCYHLVWFVRARWQGGPTLLAEFSALEAWEQRVKAIGHARSSPMASAEALDVARDAEPATPTQADPGDPQGLKPGQTVSVVADLDSGEAPVAGIVRLVDHDTIAILREDPRVGSACVHFPRVGYRVMIG